MELSKKEAKVVEKVIHHWTEQSLISAEQAEQLQSSYQVNRFNWRGLAKYSFWLAIASFVISLSAVLADEWLIAFLETIFLASDFAKLMITSTLAAVFYLIALRRRRDHPDKPYSNEAITFLGVLSTAASVALLGVIFDNGSGHFSILLLLAALIYAALGLWFPSIQIWVFALLSLGSWFGAETGYASGWGAYYLGMNYPMRFILFGLVLLIASSSLFKMWPARQDFLNPTRSVALLYLFIALWIMSIFGNYGDMDHWYRAKQIELFHWAILFGLAALAAIWHGLKYDDSLTRGYGITFIFINLYTRFFEYFWEDTHKGIFFALLAASFWYLGSRAEKIWALNELKQVVKPSEEKN